MLLSPELCSHRLAISKSYVGYIDAGLYMSLKMGINWDKGKGFDFSSPGLERKSISANGEPWDFRSSLSVPLVVLVKLKSPSGQFFTSPACAVGLDFFECSVLQALTF